MVVKSQDFEKNELFTVVSRKSWVGSPAMTDQSNSQSNLGKLRVSAHFPSSTGIPSRSTMAEIFLFLFNPFPHSDTFWHPWETSLLKTLWKKEKLLVTSNFSFSHSVNYPFGILSAIFIKFEIVVSKDQWAIVMALCLSCVCPFVHRSVQPSVCSSVSACVHP